MGIPPLRGECYLDLLSFGSSSGASSGKQALLQRLVARGQALLDGLDDEWPGDGGIAGHLGKPAAFDKPLGSLGPVTVMPVDSIRR